MTASLILKRAQEIEDVVVMLAVEQRAFGQVRIAKGTENVWAYGLSRRFVAECRAYFALEGVPQ